MTSPPAVLEVNNLRITRGGTEVISVPAFSLFEHETVALIGPNGAGKSSFMLAVASLLQQSAGEIIYRGERIGTGSMTTRYRRKIAMVFQEPLLFDTTVFENVATGLKIRGVPRAEIRQRVNNSLERMRIAHLADRSARKLSGGEAQRTSLARAFATEPELILLDEPFVALDPPTRQALTEDLEQVLRESGTAAIIATHDQVEALRLADRIMVMHQGSIVQTGTPAEVMNQPVNEFVATFVGMENIFTGTVATVNNELISLSIGGKTMEILGEATAGERVTLCIHPEHVVISTGDPEGKTSARNVFACRVVKIVPFGLFNKVYLDAGFMLAAAVTNQSLDELALKPSTPVYASFKATAVHLFRKGW